MSQDNISSANKRIAKNTAFLYVRMLFVLVVSLYTSRVILNTLGVEDFGIYNVVSGFVSMFGFLNNTLSSSMQRFYNYELGINGKEGVSKVYSSGLVIHAVLAAVLFVLLESVGLWYINNVMVIPEARLFAANCVFQAVVFSMILLVIQTPYSGAIMAYERLDYYAIISILDVILKLAIVIALPFLPYDKLITYAILFSCISILDFLCYFVYSYRQDFGIRFSKPQRALTKEVLSFSGWNLIGTFASMLKDQGLNMLLNVFFGPLINAARGVAFQVKNAIGNFTGSITTSFRPQIVGSYAKKEYDRVLSLFYLESKICICLILLLDVPVICQIDTILSVWLGQVVPQYSNIFTILVLVNMLICTINPIINQVAFATGRIKNYQIANSALNIMLLPVAWVFLKLGYEAISVFIVTIVFSIFNQVVCLTQLNKVFKINLMAYTSKVIIPCVITAILSIIVSYLVKVYTDQGFSQFILICLTDATVTTSIIYFIAFSKVERVQIIRLIKKFKR